VIGRQSIEGAVRIFTVLAVIALGGCGGAATTTTPTNGLSSVEPVSVTFRSSAIHGTALPALYTCDGRNMSPPLSWGTVPAGVKELALFVLGAHRGKGGQTLLSVEWAMAGVKPSLHHLSADETPPGAFVLRASSGKRSYSVCPPRGQTERYSFALLALPPAARASATILGLQLLQNLTQASPQYKTPASGAFAVSYTRR
jgi:phosphatidylethanolamine-binding protein (PEBP) family uncharacterized protein